MHSSLVNRFRTNLILIKIRLSTIVKTVIFSDNHDVKQLNSAAVPLGAGDELVRGHADHWQTRDREINVSGNLCTSFIYFFRQYEMLLKHDLL